MPPKDSPYIDTTGTIIIPFTADSKYHYWNGGQPLSETLMELNTTKDIWGNHTEKPYPENAAWADKPNHTLKQNRHGSNFRGGLSFQIHFPLK